MIYSIEFIHVLLARTTLIFSSEITIRDYASKSTADDITNKKLNIHLAIPRYLL